jgi:type IV secretion system protein VirD4
MQPDLQETLYRLPTFSRQHRQTVFFNALFLVVVNSLLAGLQASEYLAIRWRFHPALGRAWLLVGAYPSRPLLVMTVVAFAVLARHSIRRRSPALLIALPALATAALATFYPLYRPLSLLAWRRNPHFAAPALRAALGDASSLLVLLLAVYFLLAVAYVTLHNARQLSTGDVHGSSHWATPAEVREAGLLSATPSIVLGAWRDGRHLRTLRDPSDRHLLLFAPSRSGKTTSLVVPTLLEWPGSTVVLDIKSELWHLTAGHREKELGGLCLRFDPTSTDGTAARYNPLLTIPRSEEAVRYAMQLADALVDPDGKNLPRDFWQASAHSLLVAVILHILFAEMNKTLAGCYHFIANPSRPFAATLFAMLKTQHDPGLAFRWIDPHSGAPTPTHPVVAAGARAALDMEERTRAGVIATTLTYLSLFTDPIVAENTSTSDFTAEDLQHYDRPVSLYLTIAPAELTRLRGLIRIVLNQICQRLTAKMDFEPGSAQPRDRRPLLLLLDEFTALGKLDFFGTAMGYLAGYNIRVMLSIQSLAALHAAYGQHQSITSNTPLQVAFAAADQETAELLSKMTGVRTVHWERRSTTGGPFTAGSSRVQYAQAEASRPLLTPDEVRRLPAGEALVFVAGHPPIRGVKRRYFEIPELVALTAVSPPRERVILPHDWSHWLDHRSVAPDPAELALAGAPTFGQPHPDALRSPRFDELR